jgi:signal transduction histidine kinase
MKNGSGSITNALLSKSMQVLVGVVGVAIVFAIVFFLNLRSSTEVLYKGFNIWKPELARAIVEERWLSVDRIVQSLPVSGVDSFRITRSGRLVYTYPPMIGDVQCAMPVLFPVSHYGVDLGILNICRSISDNLWATAISPLFLTAIFFAMLFGLLIRTLSLVNYRSTVLVTLKTLKKWSQDVATELDGLSDPIEKELLELVKAGTTVRLENERIRTQLQISETKSAISAQVSHDIRSPLASLIVIAETTKGLDESTRVQMRAVVNRIRDVANQLLEKYKKKDVWSGTETQSAVLFSNEPKRVELISELIESTLSQKRLQFIDRKDVQIQSVFEEHYDLFVEAQPVEFGRILSNLINNAMEAIDGTGMVAVHVRTLGLQVIIEVCDSGKGMPVEILAKLGQRGFSQGKEGTESGAGLGVAHAMSTIESWGGTLRYQSEIGKGTQAIISLKSVEAPKWFLAKLILTLPATIIVLDDDPTVHYVWKRRLSIHKDDVTIISFYSASEIIQWYRQSVGIIQNPLYLCDYELTENTVTGIDIIGMLGIEFEAVLVTSRADEVELRDRCERKGIKLLPKGLVDRISIETVDPLLG